LGWKYGSDDSGSGSWSGDDLCVAALFEGAADGIELGRGAGLVGAGIFRADDGDDRVYCRVGAFSKGTSGGGR